MLKRNLAKRNLFLLSQGLNPLSHDYNSSAQLFNQFMFRDNFYNSRSMLSLIMIKHIIIKIMNN